MKEIDEYIAQAKDRSYETMMKFGKRGLNLAATAAVTAATKVSIWCQVLNALNVAYALKPHVAMFHSKVPMHRNEQRMKVQCTFKDVWQFQLIHGGLQRRNIY